MRVHDSVGFITGANRGLGLMFAKKNMAGELMLPEVKPADRFASAQRNRS
jgi:hypothetical protein